VPFDRQAAKLSAAISRRRLIGATAAALAMPAPILGPTRVAAARATPVAGNDPLPTDLQLALEEIVDRGLAATYTPGALVGVWWPGQGSWTKAAGIGDLETGAPARLDDHVRIASNTKTFVATVVLQLVEEGKLGLDDTLGQYIPGIANGDDVTLRQLLGMTAGTYDYVRDPRVAVDYAADPMLPFTPDDALAIIRNAPADFPPGDRMQYSNSNYVLLGLIVEQVTRNAIAAEIDRRITAPLGLADTSFPTTPDIPAPFMRGYAAAAPGDPLVDVTRSNPAVPWASGAMISTVADMRIWADALAAGSLLSPDMQRERLVLAPMPSPYVELGYGLGIVSVAGVLGHSGGIAGYSSWIVHDPGTGATVVVVTNRSAEQGGTADPIFIGICQLSFPERFPPLPTPAATPAA
jgi:D-alanyl-D-alanine carboxypeptidase